MFIVYPDFFWLKNSISLSAPDVLDHVQIDLQTARDVNGILQSNRVTIILDLHLLSVDSFFVTPRPRLISLVRGPGSGKGEIRMQ